MKEKHTTIYQLLRKYSNLEAELSIAYRHNLDFNIIKNLHNEMHDVANALSRFDIIIKSTELENKSKKYDH